MSLAQKLTEGIRARGYQFLVESPTNQVFPIFPKTLIQSIGERFGYSFWQGYDETSDAIRFCTSWATPPEQIEALLNAIPYIK